MEVTGSSIDGSAKLDASDGNDEISVLDTVIAEDLTIKTDRGDDAVYLGGSEGGLSVGDALTVQDGDDDLLLEAVNVNVGDALKIDAGHHGDSDITLRLISVGGQMRIQTGDGVDRVSICDIEVGGRTQIDLREDDDTLEIGDSTFHSDFQIDGGSDVVGDVYVDNGGNTFAKAPVIVDFESLEVGEECGIDPE